MITPKKEDTIANLRAEVPPLEAAPEVLPVEVPPPWWGKFASRKFIAAVVLSLGGVLGLATGALAWSLEALMVVGAPLLVWMLAESVIDASRLRWQLPKHPLGAFAPLLVKFAEIIAPPAPLPGPAIEALANERNQLAEKVRHLEEQLRALSPVERPQRL